MCQVTTEFQRQEFRDKLHAMEDWLYEDEAGTVAADVMYAKMLELQQMGDPIKGRVHELERRPLRVQAAVELTDLIAKATNSWPETKPWLNETHVAALKLSVRSCLPQQLCSWHRVSTLWSACSMFDSGRVRAGEGAGFRVCCAAVKRVPQVGG